ncbi:MAG: SDR family oxidoreductase [Bdellovibrionia bacterium]
MQAPIKVPNKVLVLGATGNVGSPLVEELLRRGVPVRAAVRNIPDPAPARAGKGSQKAPIEYVKFDYFDADTYEKAFEGVTALYLLTPVVPSPQGLVQALVDAAKRAGIRKIVRQSAYGADRNSTNVRLIRWHQDCEKVIEQSGIPYVILRPTGFFQNYLSYADDISRAGVFHLALGSDRSTYIDARDVARVAAVTLIENGHEGRKYNLTGPQALSNEDIADVLSLVTGDQIKFVPISDEVERRNLIEDGTPDWLAEGLVEMHRLWRAENSAQVLPTVREITGQDASPFEKFARENIEKFRRREAA